MPRTPRIALGNYVYHVLNRANERKKIFGRDHDYRKFEYLLEEAKVRYDMRILAYVLMPNHWHLLLYPRKDGDISLFMGWLSTTHAGGVRFRTKTVGEGHVYQGRFKSFLVDNDSYLLAALKYIERNPARANLAARPEEWKWGSAYRRIFGTPKEKLLLDSSPTPLPRRYREWINEAEPSEMLKEVRMSVNKQIPYGSENFRASFLHK